LLITLVVAVMATSYTLARWHSRRVRRRLSLQPFEQNFNKPSLAYIAAVMCVEERGLEPSFLNARHPEKLLNT